VCRFTHFGVFLLLAPWLYGSVRTLPSFTTVAYSSLLLTSRPFSFRPHKSLGSPPTQLFCNFLLFCCSLYLYIFRSSRPSSEDIIYNLSRKLLNYATDPLLFGFILSFLLCAIFLTLHFTSPRTKNEIKLLYKKKQQLNKTLYTLHISNANTWGSTWNIVLQSITNEIKTN
jgi:hypothetical protein